MIIDWLAELIAHHAWVAYLPLIAAFLGFAAILWQMGFRTKFEFWPGRMGGLLELSYKIGCGIFIAVLLTAGVYFGTRTSVARHTAQDNPIVMTIVIISTFLIVVPCLFRDENTKRKKREQTSGTL